MDKKLFKSSNPRGLRSDYLHIANIRHLSRIIVCLSEYSCANITTIKKYCCTTNEHISSALNWLVNNSIIKKYHPNHDTGSVHYKLNEDWLKISSKIGSNEVNEKQD